MKLSMLGLAALGFRNSTRVALVVVVGILANAGTVRADMWHVGDVITYTQDSWPDDPVAATLLTNDYGPVYASMSDVLQVGRPSGYLLSFGDASHVLAFMPQAGVAAALDSSQTNPTSTSSGLFGGDVVALQLNVDFSDAGVLVGTSGILFGDLILTDFTNKTDLGSGPLPLAILNGLTVRQFLADANTALGGGPRLGGLPIDSIDEITQDLNISFDGLFLHGGLPTQFAQDHLVAPSSVPSAPEPSSWVLLGSGLLSLAATRRWKRA